MPGVSRLVSDILRRRCIFVIYRSTWGRQGGLHANESPGSHFGTDDPFDGADPKPLPLLKKVDLLRNWALRLKKLGVTNFVVKDPTTGDDGL
jgi:hypothetical protein